MSDTKFTPGPWFVDLNNPLCDDSYAVTTGEYDTGDWIASVRPIVDSETEMVRGEEYRANARLIATVPNLYAACEAAEYALTLVTPRYGRLPEHDYLAGIRDTLRGVLAQVRGEA